MIIIYIIGTLFVFLFVTSLLSLLFFENHDFSDINGREPFVHELLRGIK